MAAAFDSRGSMAMISLLLEAGADPNIVTNVLSFASRIHDLEGCVVCAICAHHATAVQGGSSALLVAARGREIDAVALLVEAGADVSFVDQVSTLCFFDFTVHASWRQA